jgi:hypothetical protein
VSVQPNTDGYLIRSASLPANATGWTICFWFQRIGAVGTGVVETLLEVVDNGDGDYIKIYVDDAGSVHFQGINDFEDVSLFTATLNTWYFLALTTTSATAGNVYWRADASGSLSSSTGRKFQTDNGWDSIVLANAANFLEDAQHFRVTDYKEWNAALSSGQLLTESSSRAPVVTSGISCYLPLLTVSGTDQSGAGHNFTQTGTMAANASEPTSLASGDTLLMPLLATTAGLAAPNAVAVVQPPLLATTAGLPAPSAVAGVQVPTLGVTASLPVPSVRASVQPPLLATTASLPAPSAVAVVQPPLLGVTGQLYPPELTVPGPLQFPVLGVTAALFAPQAIAVVRMPTLGVKAWLGVDAQPARPRQPALARGRGTGRRGGVG